MGIPTTKDVDVVIIGAGFSGLYLLHELRKVGLSVRLIEAGSGPGGIWHSNCYPGARVDTEVPQYQFSASDTWSDWQWQQRFPDRAELVNYFEHVVRVWDLDRDIIWKTRVIAAHWDEHLSRWKIVVGNDPNDSYSCRFFCPCTGFAAKPYTPPWRGIETFKGKIYHTSEWPQEGVDMTGERVGVVGTGASGIQAIQEIGCVAKHLTVFQRTPNTAIRMINRRIDDATNDFFRRSLPDWKKKQPTTFSGTLYEFRPGNIMDMPKEERRTAYEELWSTGGLHFWLGTYFDVLTNEEANEEAYQFWRQQVITRIKDPEKARVLAPEKKLDPFGAKRVSLEQNYYDVLNKDNVAIVYLRENPIEEFISLGAKTQDGQIHEIDVLVMATGFDFVTGGLTQIDIRGINGESVKNKFSRGVRTNLGMTIHGFPNMFFMYGPQAPTAFATGPICAETQGQWIVNCINYLTKHDFKSIDATEEAERDWADHVNEVGNIGLFKNACSWYFGDNIPGKPRQALNYMAGLPAYKKRCQDSASMGYKGFQIK